MKRLLPAIVVVMLLSACKREQQGAPDAAVASAVAEDFLQKKRPENLLLWPGMGAAEFGCLLEKRFHHRDTHFNCDLKGCTDPGEPCPVEKTGSGPVVPEKVAREIDSDIQKVQIVWQEGRLREVTFFIKGAYDKQRIKRKFALPDDYIGDFENVQEALVQACGDELTCLVLTGFASRAATPP